MNFVLHGYLARRDLGLHAAAAGAMLPDLWRMADRRVRARAGVGASAEAAEPVRAVLEGIEHHLRVDAWFHASAVFVAGERAARDALARAVPGGRRVALLAHVAWELCLDGALIEREGLDATMGWIRAGFDDALGDPSERAVDAHHFHRETPVDRQTFSRRLRELARAIAAGPWVAGYVDGDGLASRLSGVRARLGEGPFEPAHHSRIAAQMTELSSRARDQLQPLLDGVPVV